MEVFLSVIVIIILFGAYFLPSIIAGRKDKKNTTAIFVLNLLLGWTLIGWIISLVWAVTED